MNNTGATKISPVIPPCLSVPTTSDVSSFLSDSQVEFSMKRMNDEKKHIIVQRSPERFWQVLLKQTFDVVQHNLVVRFAGEAGADAGGLLREFLTLAMGRFGDIPVIILGKNENVCPKNDPQLH